MVRAAKIVGCEGHGEVRQEALPGCLAEITSRDPGTQFF